MFSIKEQRRNRRGRCSGGISFFAVALSFLILSAFSISTAQQIRSTGTSGTIDSSGSQVQSTGSTRPATDQNATTMQAAQAASGSAAATGTSETQDVADISVEDTGASDITYFDGDSVPDAPDIPDADWVFEIPINVSKISSDVQRLGCTCEVFKGDKLNSTIYGQNNWQNKVSFGKNKIRIDLEDGAFQGTVYVGVQKEGNYWEATHYTCWLYLIGPDNHWYIPTIEGPADPEYRQMHSGYTFRQETYGQELPSWAKLARSEGIDAEDAQSAADSLEGLMDMTGN